MSDWYRHHSPETLGHLLTAVLDHRLAATGISLLLLIGCSTSPSRTDRIEAELDRLELRFQELELSNPVQKSPGIKDDPKAPSGPIRSLTLRTGTDDDRLRLYWADGQVSDLICTKEGRGTWACG